MSCDAETHERFCGAIGKPNIPARDREAASEAMTRFLAHHITAPVYRSPGFLLDVARYASVRIKGRAT